MRLFSLLLFAALLTGCSDNMMSPAPVDDPVGPAERITGSGTNQLKFRNAHLMDKALVPGKAGKFGNSNSLQLVFAIDKQKLIERYGIVERFAVMERYKIVERYQIVERYEYANVFDGYAITIEDSLGLSEYDDFLAQLAADDEILWFEPDFSVDMPDSDEEDGEAGQSVPWSVATVGGQSSWTASGDGTGSVDVDVYVLDTGVALADAGDPNDDLNLVESLDFRENEMDPTDEDGHGTHIAGIIGAVDDSDGLVGIAPGARIHNFKVLDDDGSTDVSVVIAAVEEITARKLADPTTPIVVNMSIGENIQTPEYSALDYAVEASIDAGVVYVVAAGNHGDDASFVTPAKVDRAITVGSYNILGLFSPFSNYGPVVDILAPGEGVVSLAPGSVTPVSMSGTSMATAHA
ncbi:MAG: S8 family serine peptidase, partial [Rhodothermales bacterium]|nr:S8 family serine peptidase [Rhodothermales bacterium]